MAKNRFKMIFTQAFFAAARPKSTIYALAKNAARSWICPGSLWAEIVERHLIAALQPPTSPCSHGERHDD
ncbi:hypothetical protein V5279_25075 [Bradyrhizobium sp. 26S5]|uniref:hypothetical protein n=1 Tax=Bradyrhizobium sp. 26S5 TaxID=3139729 RepID=UPI0030D5E9FE